ncbi:MAG: hypothetical protein IJT94_10260, partial [Oscillibacter sp.]|nr:hypothetical protein [Oscillibacter sp.]
QEAVSLLRREPQYAEAAAHIRRVMAEWGLADPIIELPAVLPAAALVTELPDGEAPAEPDKVTHLNQATRPDSGAKSSDRPHFVQKRALGRRTARPAPRGRHCIGQRDRDGEQVPKRWARPKRR